MATPRLPAAALAAVLLAFAAPVSAQTPQIRPGLWEIAMSGMPHKQTTCFTPEMVKDVKSLAQRGQQSGDCKSTNPKTAGNTHTVDISCTKPNKYDAKVTTTISGPDNFTVTQDYTVEAGGKAQQGKMTISYRRLGECK
ncbi:MAG TPA: DUF3617 family protein [Burkholderiales bacterium]|nr:DUF3617 family protein [Burkholderiales bacterium]